MSDALLLVMTALTLAALFVVGSLSIVSAAPAHEEHSGRVVIKDPPAHPKAKAKARADGWFELASPTPATNGKEFIEVDPGAGTFTTLRIVADEGRPILRSVRIEFKDGTHRVVQLDTILDAKKHPSTFVDLRGPRDLDSLVVVTDRDSRGTYSVLAITEAPNVASR